MPTRTRSTWSFKSTDADLQIGEDGGPGIVLVELFKSCWCSRQRAWKLGLLASSLSTLGGACAPADPSTPTDGGVLQSDAESGVAPSVIVTCDQMDVLFVIDNSQSMRQEQQNLSDNIDGFVDSLRRFQKGNVDFRIGVTTTQFPILPILEPPGASGALLKTVDMTDHWLSSSDPDLVSKFRALATVGTDITAGAVQPLRATRDALVDRVADGQNAGFLRPNALLALVILTDGDDVSAEDEAYDGTGPIPVSHFIDSFDSIKTRREYWSTAVFAGGTVPTCNSSFGSALFAARLQAFVEQTGSNAVFNSICEGDLGAGLDATLATFSDACEFLLF